MSFYGKMQPKKKKKKKKKKNAPMPLMSRISQEFPD